MNGKTSPFLARLDAVAAETETLLDRLLGAARGVRRAQPSGALAGRHALFKPRWRQAFSPFSGCKICL